MIRFALGALLGALSFHQLPYLPSWPWVCAAAVLLGVAWYRRLVFLSGLAGFFLWACVSSAASAPALFPDFDGGVDVLLEGQVVSLVERSGDGARFVLRADRAVLPEDRLVQGDWRIRLTWYRNAPALLRPDQRWRLTVRLRPAHGHANPGGFDFEGWLYRRGIVYTGYHHMGTTRMSGSPAERPPSMSTTPPRGVVP